MIPTVSKISIDKSKTKRMDTFKTLDEWMIEMKEIEE